MQRNCRNIFVRPIFRHQAFFHRILTASKSNVSHAHFLEAVCNSYGRENMATGSTAYEKELLHTPLLVNSKFLKTLLESEFPLI